MFSPLSERIVVDPEILAGKPVIRGTRLAVEFNLELLAAGQSENEVLTHYPGLTREDILACLLPDQKNSSLALGLAIHRALELNFREKIQTHEDLDTARVVMLFRDAWMDQAGQTQFTSDESQQELRRTGERLVVKYMDEVAPQVEPAAVELDVAGEISGVAVRGRVDILDVDGQLIDIKTASRRPSWVSPDYAFQLATYRQITPGASGEVRIDSLVKTATPQVVQQTYNVSEGDLRATQGAWPCTPGFPNRTQLAARLLPEVSAPKRFWDGAGEDRFAGLDAFRKLLICRDLEQ